MKYKERNFSEEKSQICEELYQKKTKKCENRKNEEKIKHKKWI